MDFPPKKKKANKLFIIVPDNNNSKLLVWNEERVENLQASGRRWKSHKVTKNKVLVFPLCPAHHSDTLPCRRDLPTPSEKRVDPQSCHNSTIAVWLGVTLEEQGSGVTVLLSVISLQHTMIWDDLESVAPCLPVKVNKSKRDRFIYKVLLMEEIFAAKCTRKPQGVNAGKDEG